MNLRRLQLLTVVLLLIVCSSVTFGQTGSVVVVVFQDTSVADGIESGYSDTLTFGLDPTATLCPDPLLGESELPPPPPAGVFDVRFTDEYGDTPCLGQGQVVHIQPANIAGNEYGFTLKNGDASLSSGRNMYLRWAHINAGGAWVSLVMTNDAGIDYDMMLVDSAYFTRTQFLNKYMFIRAIPSAVQPDGDLIPESFGLKQNYPNPFNPSTTIKFSIAKAAFADVAVFDVLGRRIATLASEELKPGHYTTTWNGTDDNGVAASSGVYYVRMVANGDQNVNFSQVQKLLLMK